MRRELGVLSVCLLVAFSAAAFGADTMPAEQTKKAGSPHRFIRLDIAQNAEAGRRKEN